MGIKQDFVGASVDAILSIDPSLDRDEVTNIVKREIKNKLRDPTITVDNNVTGDNRTMTLTELCNWINHDKPVVSGNATFYVQPKVLESPCSKMLRSLKKLRKSIKKEMFESKGDPDRYQQLDLSQANTKVIMNAEYGASGAPTSAFYTKYSPAATTLMAQSIITTMAALFESFVGDNMKLFHINECFDWMKRIQDTKTDEIDSWVRVPSVDEVTDRIRRHFFQYDINNDDILCDYVRNLSKSERSYLYYANNLKGFIRNHSESRELIRNVLTKLPVLSASEKGVPEGFQDRFKTANDYNDYIAKEMFLDPYNVPEPIKDDMKKLTDIIMKYCFVEYLSPDSIIKLNNHKRNTVLLVDTDSNIINVNLFTSFILGEIFNGNSFGRTSLYNDMICANILASILGKCIEVILNCYGLAHNADEESRKELTMKNEFFFRRFFLMNTKKRYACSKVLREGHIMIPFETEIKGLDFIKAGVTDDVTERFTKMLEDNVLFSENLQLRELMNELRKFERDIYQDLKQGGTKYLKSQSYKSEGAYKDPWAIQTFKAVVVWNTIMTDQKIYSLNKIKLAKLTVSCERDLDIISDSFPNEYKLCKERIFGAVPVVAPGMTQKELELSDTIAKELVRNGMKAIAIPANIKSIPEWIRPLIDYQTTIADICNSFRSVLDSFRIDEIPVKTSNGKTKVTTGLISL